MLLLLIQNVTLQEKGVKIKKKKESSSLFMLASLVNTNVHTYKSLHLQTRFHFTRAHFTRPHYSGVKIEGKRASLVAQWLRVCLPMQGTQVRALVQEDPTCRGATGPVSHNY